MAKVELKQPLIDEIAGALKDAKSAVAVDYRGLTVEQDTELRRQLREAGINYKVYKNTMIDFAIRGTEFEPLKADLEGPTALAISTSDETAPARILYEFSQKAEQLELKGGIVEGTYYDAGGIKVIATIPGREVLLGRLFGSMQSPVANLARVLKQIAENKPDEPEPAEAEEPVKAEEAPAEAEEPAKAEEAPAEEPAKAEKAPAAAKKPAKAKEAAAEEPVKAEEASAEAPAADPAEEPET